MGAGHAHHHHETSSSDAGSKITLIGLVVNIALSITKAGAGILLNSAALVADAGHSLSDLIGDFVVLLAWKLSRRRPDARFQFGYGKIESLGSAIVSLLLLAGGLGIGWHSVALLRHSTAESSHAHAHSHDVLDPNAAWFALASILIKEYLYRITKSVALKEKSNVLMANALHHRSDAYSGIVALAAIATSYLGISMADPIGGAIVAGMIAKQGVSMLYDSLLELLDATPTFISSEDVQRLLETNASSKYGLGSSQIREIRTFKIGSRVRTEIGVNLKSSLSIKDVLAIQENVRQQIIEYTDHQVDEVFFRLC